MSTIKLAGSVADSRTKLNSRIRKLRVRKFGEIITHSTPTERITRDFVKLKKCNNNNAVCSRVYIGEVAYVTEYVFVSTYYQDAVRL